MDCFCDDCQVTTSSYGDWILHLTTPSHQSISLSSVKEIQQWSKTNPSTCVIVASMFISKDPLELARKFSKFGFLRNFYIHPSRRFFVMKYDTRQTAEFSLTKYSGDTSWKLAARLLGDLDDEDWLALFPPPSTTTNETNNIGSTHPELSYNNKSDKNFNGLEQVVLPDSTIQQQRSMSSNYSNLMIPDLPIIEWNNPPPPGVDLLEGIPSFQQVKEQTYNNSNNNETPPQPSPHYVTSFHIEAATAQPPIHPHHNQLSHFPKEVQHPSHSTFKPQSSGSAGYDDQHHQIHVSNFEQSYLVPRQRPEQQQHSSSSAASPSNPSKKRHKRGKRERPYKCIICKKRHHTDELCQFS